MMNRTATLLGLLLLTAAPAFAGEGKAINDARFMSTGGSALGEAYDGCSGGVCSIENRQAIAAAELGALRTGGLVVTKSQPRSAIAAEVPAPKLTADKAGAKSKKGGGFFDGMFSGKGLMYGLGGAAAGAGVGFLLGGPLGAVIGGLVGALGGFLLSKWL
jgi:hypothetical protein